MKAFSLLLLLLPFFATAEKFECEKMASKACITDPFPAIESTDPMRVFDRVTEITTQCFYDQTFRGLDWNREVRASRDRLSGTPSDRETKQALQTLLAKLHASHTEFLTNDDQEYWAIESIFSWNVDGAPFANVGSIFHFLAGRWFVRSVFEGSPAHAAGLRRGDEIVSANGRPLEPVHSFTAGPEGRCVSLHFRRSSTSPLQNTCATPRVESLQRGLFEGAVQSERVVTVDGKRIGYFHLWAGTNDKFRELLARVAERMEQSTDALVLDLRDGYGGAGPEYLDPFFATEGARYSKPLVVLINEGVRSGKENLAFLLKAKKRATLVGTNTAGYYLGGRRFDLVSKQSSLYLAVCGDTHGAPLEGVGVAPDIEVPSPLPYSRGADPQLSRALEIASGLAP